MPRVRRPYILVVPTYGGGHQTAVALKQVIHFLNDPQNRSLIRGVIVSGNTNFDEHYCIAGLIIVQKCNVPIPYRFELLGTPRDVQTAHDLLDDLWQKQLAIERGTYMLYTNISAIPPQWRHNHSVYSRPINQNNITDEKDREIWNRLTSNFWLSEGVPLSNDSSLWNQLSDMERSMTMWMFIGLTMLDTVQATVGEVSQIQDGTTEYEQVIYANIALMQAVHACSYSSIFSTLSNTPEIDTAYAWAVNNDLLRERAKVVLQHYYDEDPLKHKMASILLSSLLLYTGFYLSLCFSARGILMNTADMIHSVLRDKAVHGCYSGYKCQRDLDLHPKRVVEMEDFAFQLPDDLHEPELKYSGEIYEPTGLMDDVAVFVCYNTGRAMMNLGCPTRFVSEETGVKTGILAALAPGSEETHDFFSGSGLSYAIGSVGSVSGEGQDF